MTPYVAQRLRFGILAARHYYAREHMTDAHMADLEGMEHTGWRIQDSLRAYDRECERIRRRRDRL